MFYSKSTGGFYDEYSVVFPDDIVEVSEQKYNELFDGQSQGKQIVADENGCPVLIIPTLSDEQRLAFNKLVQSQLYNSAQTEITWRQYSLDAGSATEKQIAQLTKWKGYVVSLMTIDLTSSSIEWPAVPAE
ncbi:tail fiber assembly protein [Kosakonia sp. ML.JS2a]|uniref:tail fiber assembly protein n=1 Tax=Kosakonia sp. ML.JS2a TaxID=2980557 RepID=UPI0021D96E82|nr:tail fiber assembly protein [Kosakonia sp. ML.JS2a]UXY12086.1 tail fiber assembly protein [Kosakonia sp. ML.JS2a]